MNTEKLEFEVDNVKFRATGVEVLDNGNVMFTIKNLDSKEYKPIKKQVLKNIIVKNNLLDLEKALNL